MTTNLMLTIPDKWHNRVALFRMFRELDVHKWIVGYETGSNGYQHLQVRLRVSKAKNDAKDEEGIVIEQGAFSTVKGYVPEAHIEECSDTWEYERKDGRFLSSEDTPEIRRVRFGKLSPLQQYWMELLKDQGDRDILVVHNPEGGIGKSWFVNWLFETNKGFYCPPTVDSVKGLIQWVASGYGMQPILAIDIPRSWKWSEQLYTAIESIKDGLVYDTRYYSHLRNIRGVKVIVFCNEAPDKKKLSNDRWNIYTWYNGNWWDYDKDE